MIFKFLYSISQPHVRLLIVTARARIALVTRIGAMKRPERWSHNNLPISARSDRVCADFEFSQAAENQSNASAQPVV